jgi:hypothetical protein
MPCEYVFKGASLRAGGGFRVHTNGTLRGYGAGLYPAQPFVNDGKVYADGFGSAQTLALTNYTALNVTNRVENPGWAGWFAVNKGKLLLPATTASATALTNTWGESVTDPTLDLINSARITFSAITGSGTITGQLYAVDRADVPAPPGNGRLVSIHEFAPSAGISGYTYTLTIRYDTSAAGVAGNEDVLRLLRHNGSTWVNVTASRDVANKTITSVPLTAFSMFAVAIPTEPGLLLQVR